MAKLTKDEVSDLKSLQERVVVCALDKKRAEDALSMAQGWVWEERVKISSVILVPMFWVLILTSLGHAQSTSTPPDAPSTAKATTCKYKSGKDCPEWVHKLIGQYPPTKEETRFQIRSWNETFKGGDREWKYFYISHSVAFLANVADAEITHQGLAGCKGSTEGNGDLPLHPSRGELYRYNLGGWGAFLGVDFLLRKIGIPVVPEISPIEQSIIHGRGAIQWVRAGCI